MTGMPRNRFKEKISGNQTTYGLWLGIPDTSVAEMMAGAGFDWLVIDHEHGPYEIRDVLAHLQAIAPYDVAPVVRPVDGNRSLLKKLCDIGVQTFLVPMIDTAQEAIAVVEAVKYPPAGSRGLGTSMARAARWNSVSGYVGQADDQMCVIVQVESSRALQNIDAIAAVDGIDAVFIGPSDLSASMGYGGDASRPEVLSAVTDALRRVRQAGKHAGLLCLDTSRVGHFVDAGANFVGIGVDTLLIGNAARSLADRFKDGNGTQGPAAGY
jgi:4-hydroxy-2-oxoheptanedioate aldolase